LSRTGLDLEDRKIISLALKALALALRVLVLGIGLEGPGLDYKHIIFLLG
jgi:hypothetical protein